MPRSPYVPCSHTDASHHSKRPTLNRIHFFLFLLVLAPALAFASPAAPAAAAPSLALPLPPGETWKIIQGYGCGSHNSWDRYSLDLVNADGRTFGAPVHAAADGAIWSWTAKSGTLILSHGGGFYTMYTHMDSAVSTKLDRAVRRGDVIGYVGERAAHGLPHLHFTAFTGHGIAASGRKSVPLSFAEGYDLPDVGGCNQHGGEKLSATGERAAPITQVQFRTAAQAEHWYNTDQRIEFQLPDGAHAFSQGWDLAPNSDAPLFSGASAGYVQGAWAGEGLHTLHVRYWDAAGAPQLASFGPLGYDTTAPALPAAAGTQVVRAGEPGTLRWAQAADSASGVAGYRVYLGADPNGTAEAQVPAPELALPELLPGAYVLRVQAIDYAGNASAWATVAAVNVEK